MSRSGVTFNVTLLRRPANQARSVERGAGCPEPEPDYPEQASQAYYRRPEPVRLLPELRLPGSRQEALRLRFSLDRRRASFRSLRDRN